MTQEQTPAIYWSFRQNGTARQRRRVRTQRKQAMRKWWARVGLPLMRGALMTGQGGGVFGSRSTTEGAMTVARPVVPAQSAVG